MCWRRRLATGRFAEAPEPVDWLRQTGQAQIIEYYRELIAAYRRQAGTTVCLTGSDINAFHVKDGATALAYRRSVGSESDVSVIANVANQTYTRYDICLPTGETWKVCLDSHNKRYSADCGGASVVGCRDRPHLVRWTALQRWYGAGAVWLSHPVARKRAAALPQRLRYSDGCAAVGEPHGTCQSLACCRRRALAGMWCR